MFAQRLRLARKKAGLSMQGLAEGLESPVSAQAISKYEAGKMMPSSAVLIGLGKSLGVSLDFLLGGQVESLPGLEFRKHAKTSAQDKARAEVLIIEELEDYLAIEDILELSPPPNVFGSLRCSRLENLEEAEDKALQLRQFWNLGLDPIPSMTGLLEDKGIKVIEAELPERFDGLTCTVKRSGGQADSEVVVVSSRTNVERKRFNLAHELAHRVILSTGNPQVKQEKAMQRFASAFLVPAERLRVEAGERRHGMTYHELIRLKHFFGISAAALLMRLKDAGILAQDNVENAFRGYARRWRWSEPEPMAKDVGYGAFEKPLRFEMLVWRALGEQLISPVRAAQMLKRPLASIERDIKGPQQA